MLHPLPLAHRLMASSACLPHIAQVCTVSLVLLRQPLSGWEQHLCRCVHWRANTNPAGLSPLQLLLTGEPALVSGAATLLLTVLQHNAGKLCYPALPSTVHHCIPCGSSASGQGSSLRNPPSSRPPHLPLL